MYVYHGTNQKNAMSIVDEGFRAGSWFTPYLDSALCFGGEYVFACWVEKADYPGLGTDDNWQFQIPEPWSRDRIVSLVHYNAEMLYVDGDFSIQEKTGRRRLCPICGGTGEVFRNFSEEQARNWLPRTHYLHQASLKYAQRCDNCLGYGDFDTMMQMTGKEKQ